MPPPVRLPPSKLPVPVTVWLALLLIIISLLFALRGAWLVAASVVWKLAGIETTAIISKSEQYLVRVRKPAPAYLAPQWRGEFRYVLPDATIMTGSFDSSLFVGASHRELQPGNTLQIRYLRFMPETSHPVNLDMAGNLLPAIALLLLGSAGTLIGLFIHAINCSTNRSEP